jgi:small subunit ribosomal protein S27Ae
MQILVRSLEETFAVSINENASLNELKAAIEDREFVPSSLQRIVKDGCTLESGSLAGCLMENDVVSLLLDVEGGMRAKWRKKRMRRLRRRRRKMRQRAR